MKKKSFTVGDIYDLLVSMVDKADVNPSEDIITFGPKTSHVNKIVVCWMSDVSALDFAAKEGANLMIVHESPFFPYNVNSVGGAPDHMAWQANHNRIVKMAKNGIHIIRMHMPVDNYCILNEFAAMLGLDKPAVVLRPNMKPLDISVFDIESCSFQALIDRVKASMNIPSLRVSNGDLNRIVNRIGIAWGGLGLFVNVAMVQDLIDLGSEAIIVGETDNYGIRFAIDAGVDVIEAGHEVSENPGLKRFAKDLALMLPELPVVFYENETPFLFR